MIQRCCSPLVGGAVSRSDFLQEAVSLCNDKRDRNRNQLEQSIDTCLRVILNRRENEHKDTMIICGKKPTTSIGLKLSESITSGMQES